jgi:PUA-domain protein
VLFSVPEKSNLHAGPEKISWHTTGIPFLPIITVPNAETMSKIQAKKRHIIRKSQVSSLFSRLKAEIGDSEAIFHRDQLEIVETNTSLLLYMVDKKPLLMELGSTVFPTLRGILEHPFPERRIVVDSGAVPYVVNGADVMRPGVVSISDDIRPGSPAQVVEERHGKPVAICIALYSAEEMQKKTSGKVCRNIHHVGDEIWALEF